jgi:hypothetical protein
MQEEGGGQRTGRRHRTRSLPARTIGTYDAVPGSVVF